MNGDALSGALSTSATTASNVGAYGIAQNTLAASSNYALTYTSANLTVTARPITVTAGTRAEAYLPVTASGSDTAASILGQSRPTAFSNYALNNTLADFRSVPQELDITASSRPIGYSRVPTNTLSPNATTTSDIRAPIKSRRTYTGAKPAPEVSLTDFMNSQSEAGGQSDFLILTATRTFGHKGASSSAKRYSISPINGNTAFVPALADWSKFEGHTPDLAPKTNVAKSSSVTSDGVFEGTLTEFMSSIYVFQIYQPNMYSMR